LEVYLFFLPTIRAMLYYIHSAFPIKYCSRAALLRTGGWQVVEMGVCH